MIDTQELSSGTLFLLPLCPSNNAWVQPIIRRVGGRVYPSTIETKEARNWTEIFSAELHRWRIKTGFQTVAEYCPVSFWFVLPRVNCDSHNYFKLICDAMERGGIFQNDKFIMPSVRGVYHDAKNPLVIFKI